MEILFKFLSFMLHHSKISSNHVEIFLAMHAKGYLRAWSIEGIKQKKVVVFLLATPPPPHTHNSNMLFTLVVLFVSRGNPRVFVKSFSVAALPDCQNYISYTSMLTRIKNSLMGVACECTFRKNGEYVCTR